MMSRQVFAVVSDEKRQLGHCIDSRLSFLSDKGGKTRVVAICDIYSQSLLSIVHNQLFKILRKLESVDGTFDQDKQRSRVQQATLLGKRMDSVDMKDCTDRFPVEIQAFCLESLGFFDNEQSEA